MKSSYRISVYTLKYVPRTTRNKIFSFSFKDKQHTKIHTGERPKNTRCAIDIDDRIPRPGNSFLPSISYTPIFIASCTL